jgi:hypothetical protein
MERAFGRSAAYTEIEKPGGSLMVCRGRPLLPPGLKAPAKWTGINNRKLRTPAAMTARKRMINMAVRKRLEDISLLIVDPYQRCMDFYPA